jgi:hypothetical protein
MFGSIGINPIPSSETRNTSELLVPNNSTSTLRPLACFATLWRLSWATRNMLNETSEFITVGTCRD